MSDFDVIDAGMAAPTREDKLHDERTPIARLVLLRMDVVDPGLSREISMDYVSRGRPLAYSPSDHLGRRAEAAASKAADELARQRPPTRPLRASGLSR